MAKATYQNQHTSAYNGSTQTNAVSVSVWAYSAALPAGKTLTSATLPNLAPTSSTSQHLFAFALA